MDKSTLLAPLEWYEKTDKPGKVAMLIVYGILGFKLGSKIGRR